MIHQEESIKVLFLGRSLLLPEPAHSHRPLHGVQLVGSCLHHYFHSTISRRGRDLLLLVLEEAIIDVILLVPSLSLSLPLDTLLFVLALDDLVLAEDLFDDFDDFHLHFRILNNTLRPARATNLQSAAASIKVSVSDTDIPKLGWGVLCNTKTDYGYLWWLVEYFKPKV